MILLTGATGFVGQAVFARLAGKMPLRIVLRDAHKKFSAKHPDYEISLARLSKEQDWTSSLKNVSCIIHLAARAHIVKETAPDPLAKFRDVNTEGTLALAEQAYHLGVKRFVFVSSIKVNGEITKPGNPFRTQDIPAPVSNYGISKMEAEKGLMVLSAKTGMEIVIIRPPLVYGPGVKGNFAHMVYWLKKGTPLPFGAIHNQRSFVALDNLVDLLVTCIDHPAAANEIFFVSDDEDVSTTELLHRLGRAIGCPARLIPIPEKLLQAAATLFGRQDIATRLCGSLQVDIEKTKNLLDWTPPLTLDAGLRKIHSETIV